WDSRSLGWALSSELVPANAHTAIRWWAVDAALARLTKYWRPGGNAPPGGVIAGWTTAAGAPPTDPASKLTSTGGGPLPAAAAASPRLATAYICAPLARPVLRVLRLVVT